MTSRDTSTSIADARLSPLQSLIEAHRAAFVAFDAVCCRLDEIKDDDAQADEAGWLQRERDALGDAETKAALAVLKFRPTTLAEARKKMLYIAEADTIRTSVGAEDVLDLLVESFLAPPMT
jgi:hypothetical protein